MIPKFRAYHMKSKMMAKVVELHLENKMATLDIYTNKIYPNSDYWWKETEVPYSEIKLMQYSDLKDSKGNEIYEGDIVQVENYSDNRMEVIFKDGCFWINYEPLWKVNVDLEVLGNIYENKELLEVTK